MTLDEKLAILGCISYSLLKNLDEKDIPNYERVYDFAAKHVSERTNVKGEFKANLLNIWNKLSKEVLEHERVL